MPKGVKANMVEEQLKGMTLTPEKATKEQKAQAEETVEKDLRDQMVLDALGREAGPFRVCPSPTCSTSSLPSPPSSTVAWIRTTSSRPYQEWPAWSAVQEVGRSRAPCSPACAPSSSPLMARVVDLSAFLGEAARTKSPSPSRPLLLLPLWLTNCPPRMTPRMLSEHSLIALA